MSNIVQVSIRPHLVSFLFQELEGETQAYYGDKKVKLAKVTRSSLLGKMIENFKEAAGQPCTARIHSFSMFLTIKKNGEKTGTFHERHDKKHQVLELSSAHALIINETLESMFRISAVEFIKGYVKSCDKKNAVELAVNEFMISHDLYATEIDPVSIKRFYYNSLKKNHSLTRLQNQISNRSYYYNYSA